MTRPLHLLPVELLVLAVLTFVTAGGVGRSDGPEPEVPVAAVDDPCEDRTPTESPDDGSTDITDVEVEHDGAAVHVTAHFRALSEHSGHTTTVSFLTLAHALEVTVDRESPTGDAWLAQTPDYGALRTPPADGCRQVLVASVGEGCDGLHGEYDDAHDRVDVTLPRSCLGSPRWVQVGVRATSYDPDDPRISRTGHWLPAGVPSTDSVDGPYGPRVLLD